MQFELWLDESGNFIDENLKYYNGYYPSFIGGILISESNLENIDFSVIDPERIHASELPDNEKAEYLVPILKGLKEQGALEVFIENGSYEDAYNGRTLYLQMMAEGLLHLLQWLDAKYESVQLIVFIASKLDQEQETMIRDEEYRDAFSSCIQRNKDKNMLFLHEETTLQFSLGDARINPKLQFADFACYMRMAGDRPYFSDYMNEIQSLYDDAFIFSLSDKDNDSYIMRSLADGNLAEAVIELYTNPMKNSSDWKYRNLEAILGNINKNGFRYLLVQLDQILRTVETRLSHEDDYEYGEALCRDMLKKGEFLDYIFEGTESYKELNLRLNLKLAEMYIKEGDIVSANVTIQKCNKIIETMTDVFENLPLFYDLQLLIAEYEIVSFQPQKAIVRTEKLIGFLSDLLSYACENIQTTLNLDIRKSSYIGKSIVLKIKALLSDPDSTETSYETFCKLFDSAEFHLNLNEIELEKLQQLRSYVELLYTGPEISLKWLAAVKYGEQIEVNEDVVKSFLNTLVNTEDEVTCKNYLLYFLLIAENISYDNPDLAASFLEMLYTEPAFFRIVDLNTKKKQSINQINLARIQKKTFSIKYHPIELIHWKIARILYNIDADSALPGVRQNYEEAIRLCYLHRDYHAMRITGLGIQADYISLLLDLELYESADVEIKELIKELESLRKLSLDQEVLSFLDLINDFLQKEDYQQIADRIVGIRL